MKAMGWRAMVNMFGASTDDVEAFQSAVGKTISDLRIEDNALHFAFTDGTRLKMWDDGQSCCEERSREAQSELSQFIGSILQAAEERDGPETRDEFGDTKESQFLWVTTSKGQFVVANYNEHNGYYGGFFIRAEAAP